MTDPDLIAAQQERAREIAREAERTFLDETQDATIREMYLRIKQGMKSKALLESKLGAHLVEECVTRIVSAAMLWLSSANDAEVAAAKIEAQGAMAAVNLLDGIMQSGFDAEKQLRSIEDEIGDSR